jgi:hypothetical protein
MRPPQWASTARRKRRRRSRGLLDAGARMDVRDDILKSTPIGWACRWGRAGVADVMLERGADPVEGDAELWARPRAWAEKMGHGGVLLVLRKHGVDLP